METLKCGHSEIRVSCIPRTLGFVKNQDTLFYQDTFLPLKTKNDPHVRNCCLPPLFFRLLVLRNRRSAMGVYSVYTQTHPLFRDMEGPPYQEKEAALLNFTWFLLLSTERYLIAKLAH